MKKSLFLVVALLALGGCTKTQTISIPSSVVVNPCDAIMHTTGYMYYHSENLQLRFCYLPSEEYPIALQESWNKIFFNDLSSKSNISWEDMKEDLPYLEVLDKDPNITLNMYLSQKFVWSTCTVSCNKEDSSIETCFLLWATQDFVDKDWLIPYKWSCPTEYLANQIYRTFIVDPMYPGKVIFNNQVGGDRWPAGVIDSIRFE